LPNIKAAEKWVRQSVKRTTRNLDAKSRLKTLYKKAVSGEENAVPKTTVESQLDKAASKGIIHRNKAARKKSRLAKAIVAAANAPVKTAKPTRAKKSGAKKSAKKSSK